MRGPTHTAGTHRPTFDLVIAADRLPVDRVSTDAGDAQWHRGRGCLATAMDAMMRGRDGAWVGWAGEAGSASEPFTQSGIYLRPVGLSASEVAEYGEGFSNATLWPICHDVIVPAQFHRPWWRAYREVNQRFAEAVSEVAAPDALVWVHDYQLQLVPAIVRRLRPDVRIGWFNHVPFPPVELFAQLPWRRDLLLGLLGADYLGFQCVADAQNFRRACRQLAGATTRGETVVVPPSQAPSGGSSRQAHRVVRASAIPISIDSRRLDDLSRRPDVTARATEIRASLGNPTTMLLGIDPLDHTKGIRHRLRAYEELLRKGSIGPPDVTLVQVSTPSRERGEVHRTLRAEVETTVGRINGEYSILGSPAVRYLHRDYPLEEMAALFLAADVMLVTPLRDGMNLVAKEYVMSRHDLGGALVLSEFAGAHHELHQSFVCNPHDVTGLEQTILRAIATPDEQKRRAMRAMRRRVLDHDVHRWARRFLDALASAPARPQTRPMSPP